MPNHCINRLTVTGPPGDVAAFVGRAHGPTPRYKLSAWDEERLAKRGYLQLSKRRSSIFSFHALVPIPPDVEAQEYDPAGHACERELWGVKWGAYDEERLSVADGRADYRFTTAWSPPILFLQRVSGSWPTLTFLLSYGEENPSRGRAAIAAGVVERLADDHGNTGIPYDEQDDDAYHDAVKAWERLYLESHDAWVAERGRLWL